MTKPNKFIVIEGLDGSGKSTQLKLITAHLQNAGIKYQHIHFPVMGEGYYGQLTAEFLRGDLGALDQVHPKIAALIFAGNRVEHLEQINQWLADGYVVIADRYVNSNIAFQCAKFDNQTEKDTLKKWILEFEYEFNLLPRPASSLFLDVPFASIKKSLTNQREGDDRAYLQGKSDIHEDSLDLQEKVRQEYLQMVKEQPDFHLIKCSDEKGNYLPPEQIHAEIKARFDQLNEG
ncbi:dTMP kinase [Microscilla marina]|uniref:Thymidylate kinase n=1 Tax=Microscilla marina ATCC 23134 TaxID=313606 RepID=A1ZN65_MICM2|nr:dTMP kinase [Microscilla marina]EAY28246.1 thymidylate kinase [Microscilla marina ATCC 23134]